MKSQAPRVTVTAGQKVELVGVVTEFNTGAASNADTAAHTVTDLKDFRAVIAQVRGAVRETNSYEAGRRVAVPAFLRRAA